VVSIALDPKDREEEIRLLADAIERDFPHMQRAVSFYRNMVEPAEPAKPFQRLDFTQSAPSAGSRWCEINLGERPPRPKPHCLEVGLRGDRASSNEW